ncbi:pilin [Enterovibrio norvegicus]|uniref:pilin n=1 Tax=Enterovibrio norvegicus TaxID=188144 RepID=UPI0024B24B0A|nr:pilin [Enterovibrio norvegicus]
MKKQKGFSLIELLIVVGIIGALTAIAVPAYQNYQTKSETIATIASLKNMRTIVEVHIQEGNDFPTAATFATLGDAPEITSTPVADSTGGALTITLGDDPDADPVVAGDVFSLTRNADTGVWTCLNPRNADVEVEGCPGPAAEG